MQYQFSVSDFANYGKKHHNPQGSLLDPLHPLKKRQKPQISSIPGVPANERQRYRVMVAGEILGDYLSADEALELAAKGGEQ